MSSESGITAFRGHCVSMGGRRGFIRSRVCMPRCRIRDQGRHFHCPVEDGGMVSCLHGPVVSTEGPRRRAAIFRLVHMPIYDYSCRKCNAVFDLLVRGGRVPECPSCRSEDLERLMSLPRVRSSSTRDQSLRAARKRDSAQAKDRMHDRLHYEQSHDRHG